MNKEFEMKLSDIWELKTLFKQFQTLQSNKTN